jgi:hypothetical protein
MDFSILATQLTQMLAPFMPYLVAGGKSFTDGAIKKAGADSFTFVKDKIWARIKPGLNGVDGGNFAAGELAESPDSSDYRNSFTRILAKVLEDDELRRYLEGLVTPAVEQRVTADAKSFIADIDQNASGEGRTVQEVTADDQSQIHRVRQHKT